MHKGRLEAFSDGVLAIIITIMVLELKVPHEATSLASLQPLLPVFLSYVLSFLYVAIYWNNHHHMLHTTSTVTASILWANLHLLFWLSLVPFVTGWMGENHFASTPAALYGFVLLMAAIAYSILQYTIIHAPRAPDGKVGSDRAAEAGNALLARAIGRDLKGKLAIVLYAAAIGLSLLSPYLGFAIYVGVALMWLVPDRRIERALAAETKAHT